MLSKCFNPACSARFLYLHKGKLFRFAGPGDAASEHSAGKKVPRRVEFFWLCEDCAGQFTLVADAAGRARMAAIHRRATGAAATL
jgi:hypothetical protein